MKIEPFKARVQRAMYFKGEVKEVDYSKMSNKTKLAYDKMLKNIGDQEHYYYMHATIYEMLSFGKTQLIQAKINITEEEYEQQFLKKGDTILIKKCQLITKSTKRYTDKPNEVNTFYNKEDLKVVKDFNNNKKTVADGSYMIAKIHIKSKNIQILQRVDDDYSLKIGDITILLKRGQYLEKYIINILDNQYLEALKQFENQKMYVEIHNSFGKWKRFMAIPFIKLLDDGTFMLTIVRQSAMKNTDVYSEYWLEFCGYKFEKSKDEFFDKEHTFYLGNSDDENARKLFADFELLDKTEVLIDKYCTQPQDEDNEATTVQLASNLPAILEVAEIDNNYYMTINIDDADKREKIQIKYKDYLTKKGSYDFVKGSHNKETEMCLVKERVKKTKKKEIKQ